MFLGQGIIWFQANGQFLWDGWKKNPMIVALFGFPVSYIMILGTKYFYWGFQGIVWPGRLIGFACGILLFGFLTHYIMHEPVTLKTLLSIGLALGIVIIQVFMK